MAALLVWADEFGNFGDINNIHLQFQQHIFKKGNDNLSVLSALTYWLRCASSI